MALDARDGRVAIRGWTETSEVSAAELAGRMADLGVVRLLYTDIARDGTLEEPNYAATAELVRGSGLKVLSAGGVGAAAHVARLVGTGAEGAIIGRALYTGDVSNRGGFGGGAVVEVSRSPAGRRGVSDYGGGYCVVVAHGDAAALVQIVLAQVQAFSGGSSPVVPQHFHEDEVMGHPADVAHRVEAGPFESIFAPGGSIPACGDRPA